MSSVKAQKSQNFGLRHASTISKTNLIIFGLIFVAIGGYVIYRSFAAASTNIYISQNAVGANSGADCADAHATTFFNSVSNWGSNTGQIGPGTMVHLCGTITSTLYGQGSGASGNPITIVFENGASLSQPYCSVTDGCLNLDNESYVTINGNGTGVIQSSANGTSLANHKAAMGISLANTSHIIVENLAIQNLYVHPANSAGLADDSNISSISQYAIEDHNGSNNLFSNLKISDSQVGIFWRDDSSGYMVNTRATGITFLNVDHPLTPTFGYAGGSAGPFFIDHNDLGSFSNWDTNSNAYHHDGIHCYTSSGGAGAAHVAGVYVYDNYFHDEVGSHITSPVFMEGGSGTPCADASSPLYFFNNVIEGEANGSALLGIFSGLPYAYNNTLIAASPSGIRTVAGDQPSTTGAWTFKNNVIVKGNPMVDQEGSFASGSPDYDVYEQGTDGGNEGWRCHGSLYNFSNQFANWQSCSGGDSHGKTKATSDVNSDGTPQPGSVVLGAGTNLSSLCTGNLAPLCQDIDGNARPASGTWDAGAFQASGSGGGGGGSDATAPSVSLTSPVGGATVSGSAVTVSANASDNVAVASVQFKLDGNNLGAADTSSPYSITWNTTSVSNGSHVLTAVATDSSNNTATSSSVTVTVNNSSPGCNASSTAWQNSAFTAQSGNFSATFSVTPSANNMDGVVGLASGAASSYGNLATIVRFNSSGFIDAVNGGSYSSDASVPYTAGTIYQIKIVASVSAHTYSVYVTPAGGSQIILASNYAFRTEQASVSSLNDWAMVAEVGNHSVCNFTLAAVAKTGDLNNDGQVNIFDLSILLSNYGQTGTASQGDLNGDGTIGVFDLSILLSNYGA